MIVTDSENITAISRSREMVRSKLKVRRHATEKLTLTRSLIFNVPSLQGNKAASLMSPKSCPNASWDRLR